MYKSFLLGIAFLGLSAVFAASDALAIDCRQAKKDWERNLCRKGRGEQERNFRDNNRKNYGQRNEGNRYDPRSAPGAAGSGSYQASESRSTEDSCRQEVRARLEGIGRATKADEESGHYFAVEFVGKKVVIGVYNSNGSQAINIASEKKVSVCDFEKVKESYEEILTRYVQHRDGASDI